MNNDFADLRFANINLNFGFFTLSFVAVFGLGIWDPRSRIREPGWVKIRIRIRDKYSGSATLQYKEFCFTLLGSVLLIRIHLIWI
jgi:hypothetical protein